MLVVGASCSDPARIQPHDAPNPGVLDGAPSDSKFDAAMPAMGPLADLWAGRQRFVPDPAFAPPTELRGHVETATVTHGGQHLMLYRTFVDQPGDKPAIALATSVDGDTWTAYDGGRPVIGRGGAPGGVDDGYAIAPAVMSDGTTLTAVYEALPASGKQLIAAATSTDGIHWTKLGAVVPGSNRSWERGNTGTPSILRVAGTTYVFYHGFRGSDGTGALARGYAAGPSVNALVANTAPVLTGQADSWTDVGIGRGDIVQEGPYFYMVLEGTRGSALCLASTQYGWGLARSLDLIHWEMWPYNAVLTDTDGSCGNDMPAWQVIGNRIMVVTTTSDTSSVRRFKLAPAAAAGTVLATYEAENDLMHQTGQASGGDWIAMAPRDGAGALAYGPYVATLPSGPAEVHFRLSGAGTGTVATVDVNDVAANRIMAQRNVSATQLPATGYVDVVVPIMVPPDPHPLEFRVWWKGVGTLRLDRVTIKAHAM